MANYPLTIGTLPTGFCPTTYQSMLAGFGAQFSVDISATSGASVSIGATKPSDTSGATVWFQIDGLGRFTRMYLYGQGSWLSAHPLVPGTTVWWFAALPNFTTFDGGDNNTLGAASGPMWQQALDSNGNLITAQFPVTAGTLPSATVLALGGVGGEEKHILSTSEGAQDPTHKHVLGKFYSSTACIGYFFTETSSGVTTGTAYRTNPSSSSMSGVDISTLSGLYLQSGIVDPPESTVVGHNTLPPYAVGYLLQRSTRQFYSVA